MPTRNKLDIGFNRKVRAIWLNETLQLVAAGVNPSEIETTLKDRIAVDNKGKETIRKVFVYLNRVWLQPPAYCIALRDSALEMFRRKPDSDSAFLLNWGMCMAAYPFIGHVADSTGRLLRLQGEVHAKQVNVRLRERFGDRHFIHRSVRYNLSTFLEAGALKEGKKLGFYVGGRTMTPRDDVEAAWLIEALLHTQDGSSLPLQQLSSHNALFPFDMSRLSASTISANKRIELFRHGYSETLVSLKMKSDNT